MGRLAAAVLALATVAAACGPDAQSVGDWSAAEIVIDPDVGDEESEHTPYAATGGDTGWVSGAPPIPFDLPAPLIRVDQFGYRPGDAKIAVIADPEVGFDADIDHQPGPLLEVHRVVDGDVVFFGEPEVWGNGLIHAQSGDRGWWFDFTAVTEPGEYIIIDPVGDVRSDEFRIAEDVYDPLLGAALKAFWFNRGNVAHAEEFAGPWTDGAAFVGPGQDTEARSIDDPDNVGLARDLSGGWFDAGDTNKYVTFAMEPVHSLLTAYARHPDLFDDAVGIPESGNGVPDVLDEVWWELEWLTRMQLDDGSVLTKVGVTGPEGRGLPSQFDAPRFYEEACSSATIAAAGMFGHGALVLGQIPEFAERAADLEARAVAAWDWYQANERRDDCDEQVIRAGDADLSIAEQDRLAVVAAVYLAALQGERRFHAAVAAEIEGTLPFVDDAFGRYGPHEGDAVLRYRTVPGAWASTVAQIDRRLAELREESSVYGPTSEDLYRAHMDDIRYHWGSNMVTANAGAANLITPAIDGGSERALGHLHYLHGVNPVGLVYLTNMGGFGAERSAQTLFHFWFGERSIFDVGAGSSIGVPPGYLVGGPNGVYSGPTSPPAGQPPQKSYRDWSAYGSEPTWEISEPAIYYQSAYVRLLTEVLGS